MQTLFKSTTKFLLLSTFVLLVFNCSKDDNASLEDQTISSTEVKTILETDDLSSAADQIITDLFQNGQSGKSSKLVDCYTSEFSDTGFTVTFDNCSVDGSDNISGSLTVTYKAGAESSAFTATYTDLSVGDYTINGTRSFTISGEGETVSVTIISDMTIELKDGSTIEEMGSKTFGFVFDTTNLENSGLTIDGDWTVKANGNTYSVKVTTPLVFTGGCAYVGKGVMQLSKNGLKVDVDFGDGTCDDMATVTYPDGTMEEISLDD